MGVVGVGTTTSRHVIHLLRVSTPFPDENLSVCVCVQMSFQHCVAYFRGGKKLGFKEQNANARAF